MKKTILILAHLLLVCLSGDFLGQNLMSPGGVFDKIYDRFGNQYALSSLNVNNMRPIGGPFSVNALPTNTCGAGYFKLWFVQGSICDLNPTAKNLMCELFTNISGLIPSPLTSTGQMVNILCADYTGTATAAAFATPYYVFPNSPSSAFPGVIENQAQKAIITGSDPYLNIPATFNNATAFYHGAVYTSTSTNWTYATTATTIAPGTVDFYSNHLHEAMHILGILSLINYDSYSAFGQANNYFGTYDKFLVDNAGTHLITSSTPTSCPNSNIAFTSSLVSAISTATSGCITDISTCSSAIQYSSSAVTMTVYTPNCWEPGSSLSHLEDICLPSGSTVSASCFTANGNSTNNLYYVMANRTYTGDCYVKRFLKEEERKILCDLGYSVNSIYTSNAVIDGTLTSHSYTAGACSPTAVILGLNDGVVNGAYIYTTTGTSTVIPFTSLLANDSPSTGLSVSCLELVYTSVATLTVGGTNFTVSAPQSSGLVLLKYFPVNSSGQLGNATYVYVYFIPANCNSSGMCNLINNGGFETANSCGLLGSSGPTVCSCWIPVDGINYLYSQGCSSGLNNFNLGNNTLGTPSGTPINNYGGPGNNAVALNWLNWPVATPGVIKNNLSSPIVPTHTYQLSLFADNYLNPSANNTNPVVISIATSSVYAFTPSGAFPSGLDVIAEFTLAANTIWSLLTHTFVFTPSVSASHYAFLIGINSVKTLAAPGTTFNPSLSSTLYPPTGIFCFLDDIALSELPGPTFSIPSPTICGNQSFTNLAQYISPTTPGNFAGPHVTNPSTGVHHFNYNNIVPPGNYPIAFTYSSNTFSCTNTIYQMVTIGTNTNFVTLSPANLCLNSPTLDLNALVTNTNITGTTFSLGGIQVVSPYTFTAAGQYTLSASNTSTNVCSATIYTTIINVYNPSTPAIYNGTTSVSSVSICSSNILTLTATSSGSVFTWQPGNLSGATQNLSPTVTTVYTVSVYDYSACPSTSTLAVVIVTNCCSASIIPVFSTPSTSTSIVPSGPLLITNDFTVQAGGILNLTGNFMFTSTGKITVQNGGVIVVDGAHLHACENDMWQGIVIKDGASFASYNTHSQDNLIEDAITAIDASGQAATTLTMILNVTQTTFNKNLYDIKISNYTQTASPFYIVNNVFTCRNLPFTSTSWPQTGTVSSSTGTAADLRYATSSPTLLSAPFLGQVGFSVTTLKNPYSSQSSQTAIQLTNVGVTSGTTMYGLAVGNATFSNLFDSHSIFIDALNSNVRSHYNTYQNTLLQSGAPGIGVRAQNSYGSIHTMGLMELIGPFPLSGAYNSFYDCHTAVKIENIDKFYLKYAQIKSTQSSSNAGSPNNHGYFGVNILSNRFSTYSVSFNAFYNVHNGVYAAVVSNVVTSGGSAAQAQVWGTFDISYNLFSRSTGTPLSTDYISNAVVVESILPTEGISMGGFYSTAPFTGLKVQLNNMDGVWRGIHIQNFATNSYGKYANNNLMTLVQDANSSNPQWGTRYEQINAGIANTNTVTGFGTSTAVPIQGMYASMCTNNGVKCNNFITLPIGTEFSGLNSGMIWAFNTMTNNARGMQLNSAGIIGQQGTFANPSDNKWEGTWSGSNYTTFTDNSFASNSKLYRRTTPAAYTPTNNSGLIGANTYSAAGNLLNANNSPSVTFGCAVSAPTRGLDWVGTKKNLILEVAGRSLHYGDDPDVTLEINDILAYKDLHQDTTLRESDEALQDYYNTMASGPIGTLNIIEEYLAVGNFDDAYSDMGGFTPATTIQTNYKAFYLLYYSFKTGGLNDGQKSDLLTLAQKCPFTDGPVIYNARALYNLANGTVEIYNDTDCGSEDERKANFSSSLNSNYRLFPNPTTDNLTIFGKAENEQISILIRDVSGRTVLSQKLTIKEFKASLKFNLLNGVYFVTLIDKDNVNFTKKLVISK